MVVEIVGFDPFERAEEVSRIVSSGIRRKYYRIRYSKQYFGEVTADCLGCLLDCAFCWSYNANRRAAIIGKFYSPEELLEEISKKMKKHTVRVRLSGGEPFLNPDHVSRFVKIFFERFPDKLLIIETNGLMIARNPQILRNFRNLENLEIRLSIKACTPEIFEKVTGARSDYFYYQLRAAELLLESRVNSYIAVVYDFCTPQAFDEFVRILGKMGWDWLEIERIIPYEFAIKRLRERGLSLRTELRCR